MAEQTGGTAGSIYDLGYRSYKGERLGRLYGVWALFLYNLRATFGIGRSWGSKAVPWGLAVVALVPSFVHLAIASITPADVSPVQHENYFEFVQVVLVLFCAGVAPELVSRDQGNNTLALYFSRALSRGDYVTAKVAALVVALASILIAAHLILFIGNAVAADDILTRMGDDLDQIPPILASTGVVALFIGSISLAIACHAKNRAFAAGGVIVYFVMAIAIVEILVETTTGDVQRHSLLLGPHVVDGAVYWLFGAEPTETVAESGLAGEAAALGALAYVGASLAILYRRFLRMTV